MSTSQALLVTNTAVLCQGQPIWVHALQKLTLMEKSDFGVSSHLFYSCLFTFYIPDLTFLPVLLGENIPFLYVLLKKLKEQFLIGV